MSITKQDIVALLAGVKGTTFAQINYDTEVKPAAANKHHSIRKLTSASVQLFAGLKDFAVYKRQVERSAGTEDFQVSDTWFAHTDCFSVVEHKTSGKHYLYAIFNNAHSTFTVDGAYATRGEVAALLTPSAAKALQDDSGEVYNKTNDVTHTVICRTVALENVKAIRAVKQEITA